MNKKLVQINVVCNGSTGRIMNQIQEETQNQGWEAYSFYGRGNPSNDKCIKIGSKFDVLFHVLITRLFDKHGHGSKRATRKLVKQIEEINPDVIQLHNIHGYYIHLKTLFNYLKKCNKKIVWTLHDCWAFTGHCSHFTYPKCDKWEKGCKKCIRKKDYPKSLIFDSSKNEYLFKKELFTNIKNLTIVTPSNWLADLVKKSFLKEYEVEVINNGIDLDVFKPTDTIEIRKKYNIPEGKKILLGVSSVWNISKGLNEFYELAKIINKDYIILLVGLNKKQIINLPNNIIGIERTENLEELANFYTNAYVFINPTLEDTFPTTNLEALACGTPVITYNTGGSPESIINKCGVVIKENNVKKLYEEILNLNNDVSQKCIEQGKKYNKNNKYKEYIETYER